MKVLNKAGLSAALVVLFPALAGCAPRVATPPPPPPQPQVIAYAPATVLAAQGSPLPQDWTALQGWPLPQGWSLPPAWQTPAAWPFPWPSPQPQARKPPSVSLGAPAAIAYARSRLGTPYCWGGTGPGCYDCSGLTSTSWKAGGKTIPRTSGAQADQLPEVPLDQILPGDILWRPGHVALYVGNGQVIHAPHTGDVVRYAPAVRFVKAVRP